MGINIKNQRAKDAASVLADVLLSKDFSEELQQQTAELRSAGWRNVHPFIGGALCVKHCLGGNYFSAKVFSRKVITKKSLTAALVMADLITLHFKPWRKRLTFDVTSNPDALYNFSEADAQALIDEDEEIALQLSLMEDFLVAANDLPKREEAEQYQAARAEGKALVPRLTAGRVSLQIKEELLKAQRALDERQAALERQQIALRNEVVSAKQEILSAITELTAVFLRTGETAERRADERAERILNTLPFSAAPVVGVPGLPPPPVVNEPPGPFVISCDAAATIRPSPEVNRQTPLPAHLNSVERLTAMSKEAAD